MSAESRVLAEKYEILTLIGKGGMGSVYKARHLSTDRQVAVKLLREELASKPENRTRFEREAKAAGRIDHVNVCDILDSGIDEDGVHYIIMPLLRGRPLKELIYRDGPLPQSRALDIAIQIVEALIAAHGEGVIHRDLKPDNVFLTQGNRQNDVVKILDFGITKLTGTQKRDEDLSALTRTGAVLGTPCYMAPEQARGARSITGQVDLYAVGVILYEMLAGVRPITGDNYAQMLWKLWNAPVEPPSARRPALAPVLEDVLLRAMARDREQRYQRAEDLLEALQSCLEAVEAATIAEGTPIEVSSGPTDPLETNPTMDDTPAVGNGRTGHPTERSVTTQGRRRVWGRQSVTIALTTLVGLGLVGWVTLSLIDEPSPAVPLLDRAGQMMPDLTHQPAPTSPTTLPQASDESNDETDESPGIPVRISLEGLPPEARVTVDGQSVTAPTFEIAARDEAITVAVEAPGFQRWSQAVEPTGDQITLEVQLERSLRTPSLLRQKRNSTRGAKAPQRHQPERMNDTFGLVETFGAVP